MSWMYNYANFGWFPLEGSKLPIKWKLCQLILKIGGALPLFIDLSILPPIDIKTKHVIIWSNVFQEMRSFISLIEK